MKKLQMVLWMSSLFFGLLSFMLIGISGGNIFENEVGICGLLLAVLALLSLTLWASMKSPVACALIAIVTFLSGCFFLPLWALTLVVIVLGVLKNYD